MKAQILKIAGVKNEKEFYKKFPTEEAFMKKHGKELKKADPGAVIGLKQPKKMDVNIATPTLKAIDPIVSNAGKSAGKFASYFGGIGDSLKNMDKADVKGLASGVASGLSGIIGGFDQLKEEKKQIANANMWGNVSSVVAAAAGSRPQAAKRRYVRPEDQMVENMNPLGVTGDNFLQAANGTMIGGNPTEIQNTYAPNVMYTDLGYEPLNDSNKVKNFKKGGKLKQAKSGVAQILGGVGTAASAIPGIGTVASIALPLLGDVYDLIIPDKNAQELKKKEEELAMNMGFAQGQNQVANTFGQYQDSGSIGRDGWVSHDWQPQVITKFGDLDVSQVHAFAHDGMPEYRAGGHLKEYTPPSAEAMYTGRADYGTQMAMGGDLQVHRGKAETISYNPYLPNGGETVMFKGPSHDNGGMPISFGKNGVEVEGGEPAQVMQDGGKEDNLVVYGNMIADAAAAAHIGDPKAKNRKYKNLIADYSKVETKANKTIEKATMLANNPDATKLELTTAEAMMKGGDLTLAKIADQKVKAAEWQNAILDIADTYGLESDALAKGNLKQAKFGGKFDSSESFAKGGKKPKGKVKPPVSPFTKKGQAVLKDKNTKLLSSYFDIDKSDYENELKRPSVIDAIKNNKPLPANLDKARYDKIAAEQDQWMGMGDKYPSGKLKPYNEQPMSRQQSVNMAFPGMIPAEAKSSAYIPDLASQILNARANQNAQTTDDSGMSWEDIAKTAYASAYPFLRQKVTNPLDASQIAPEMLAMSMNEEEPVGVQSYSPMLTQPTRYSFQDQLNEITKQTRAAERMNPYNPEAQSIIAANAYDARNKVLGEQSRINQGEQARVAEQNRGALNEAQRFNIGLFDQQMARTSQAKSNTKQQKIEIAKSIAQKIQENKQETRQANLMQNMYPGFNFTQSGVAYKDPLYLAGLNTSGQGRGSGQMPEGMTPTWESDSSGRPVLSGYKKKKDDKLSRNGSLVKAIKNL
jgi:hypothetical protein